ncbi:formylglycine-generating enzyme family protein [Roseateles oligotrophus]|uniref:Formylglycine-generating enzyme family protein n=1 Tax=Roseateles oligotrophus TaxID=1769250 RepID=A0ABT2YE94_9BURK|nr:formylglycine-generating enzyme family protein [Roseateles oligotrophus]MCV2368353.1 formylglycine-generating enzyme family protein [Roseateles oligotrophus]
MQPIEFQACLHRRRRAELVAAQTISSAYGPLSSLCPAGRQLNSQNEGMNTPPHPGPRSIQQTLAATPSKAAAGVRAEAVVAARALLRPIHLSKGSVMKNVVSLLSMLVLSSPLLAATDPLLLPSMATIKGGEFSMGSTANPKEADYPVSEPIHTVKVQSFRLSRYETTVGQFRQFVELSGYKIGGDCIQLAANDWGFEVSKSGWDAAANAPSDSHPVMCVSWDDAHAYLQWLSKQTGRHFRLPSEAEWEYAARAGTNTRYPYGDDPTGLCKYANVFDHSGKPAIARLTGKDRKEIACDDQAALTTVVGMYEPNAWGLHDMLGNVAELTEDCQHLSYEGAPKDGAPWTKACDLFHGQNMVIRRGGSYNSGPTGASPTHREHIGLDGRTSLGEGFRIAEDVSGDSAHGSAAFEAGLAKAQAAERSRRAK